MMRLWIRCLRRRHERRELRVTPGQKAASGALAEARCGLDEVQRTRPQAEAAAEAMRGWRQRNHFGEMIRDLLEAER